MKLAAWNNCNIRCTKIQLSHHRMTSETTHVSRKDWIASAVSCYSHFRVWRHRYAKPPFDILRFLGIRYQQKKVTKYYPSHFIYSTWLSSGTFGCIQGFYKGVVYFKLSHISSAFTWCTLIWQHRKCIANTSVPLAKVYRIVIFGVLGFFGIFAWHWTKWEIVIHYVKVNDYSLYCKKGHNMMYFEWSLEWVYLLAGDFIHDDTWHD